MTRFEAEMSLLQMGKEIRDIVAAYAPNANHASITIVDGTIMIRSSQWDNVNDEFIEADILDAIMCPDGSVYCRGQSA